MVQPEGSSSIDTKRRAAMEMSVGEASCTYPGFRFNPTDEELIQCYLTKKLQSAGEDVGIIPEVDICKHEPWDLPAESIIPSDREWYFFTARGKKYPTGSQNKRATAMGYWKATGKERSVKLNGNIIGTKRTLVFHRGRAPRGQRTEWIMHEFCTIEKNEMGIVVCRLKKNEEFNLDDNAGRDSRDESAALNINTSMLSGGEQSGGEQSQMEGIQLYVGEQSQMEGIQRGEPSQSQMEGIQLSRSEQSLEGIQLSRDEQSLEGMQLSGGEQFWGGIQLEISSLIECDSSYNSHSIEQPISEERPASEECDEIIAENTASKEPDENIAGLGEPALEKFASHKSDEKIAASDEPASEESDERNVAELGSEESDERIAEFFHGSSSLIKTNIEEDEDDCYTDIMKDDIIKLDDENFGDTLESEIKHKEMPSQGTAHRRIRLRKHKSFRCKPSKPQNEVIASKYQRSFIANIIYPSILMFLLVVLVVIWVVGWNDFHVLGYYP